MDGRQIGRFLELTVHPLSSRVEMFIQQVELDELIDRANRQATEDVLSLGDSPQEREYGLRMLVISRCVERIGDHAVDIGEQVAYMVTGELRELTDASHPQRGV